MPLCIGYVLLVEPDGSERAINVAAIEEDVYYTTFGTFKKNKDGVHEWIVDPRYTLKFGERTLRATS